MEVISTSLTDAPEQHDHFSTSDSLDFQSKISFNVNPKIPTISTPSRDIASNTTSFRQSQALLLLPEHNNEMQGFSDIEEEERGLSQGLEKLLGSDKVSKKINILYENSNLPQHQNHSLSGTAPHTMLDFHYDNSVSNLNNKRQFHYDSMHKSPIEHFYTNDHDEQDSTHTVDSINSPSKKAKTGSSDNTTSKSLVSTEISILDQRKADSQPANLSDLKNESSQIGLLASSSSLNNELNLARFSFSESTLYQTNLEHTTLISANDKKDDTASSSHAESESANVSNSTPLNSLNSNDLIPASNSLLLTLEADNKNNYSSNILEANTHSVEHHTLNNSSTFNSNSSKNANFETVNSIADSKPGFSVTIADNSIDKPIKKSKDIPSVWFTFSGTRYLFFGKNLSGDIVLSAELCSDLQAQRALFGANIEQLIVYLVSELNIDESHKVFIEFPTLNLEISISDPESNALTLKKLYKYHSLLAAETPSISSVKNSSFSFCPDAFYFCIRTVYNPKHALLLLQILTENNPLPEDSDSDTSPEMKSFTKSHIHPSISISANVSMLDEVVQINDRADGELENQDIFLNHNLPLTQIEEQSTASSLKSPNAVGLTNDSSISSVGSRVIELDSVLSNSFDNDELLDFTAADVLEHDDTRSIVDNFVTLGQTGSLQTQNSYIQDNSKSQSYVRVNDQDLLVNLETNSTSGTNEFEHEQKNDSGGIGGLSSKGNFITQVESNPILSVISSSPAHLDDNDLIAFDDDDDDDDDDADA